MAHADCKDVEIMKMHKKEYAKEINKKKIK